jgi:hypothetical protein
MNAAGLAIFSKREEGNIVDVGAVVVCNAEA